LRSDQGIIINGIVMVSPFLEGGLIFNANRFALGAALQLPSLAAAELDRRHAFTDQALDTADRFAMTEYLTTLAGKPPEGDAAQRFYGHVAELTGLPIELVTRNRGFVRDAYIKRQREGRIVSPYDASFAVADPYPESEGAHGGDPMLDGFTQALGGLFVTYARYQLGFKTEMTYMLLNREVSGSWEWGREARSRASAAGDLRELLALNPSFRVFIAHGRSDLVTPFAATRYVVDHLPPIGAPGRVQLKLYKGGHMHYLAPETRTAVSADVAAFYRGVEQ
jgi:carboxypeptidase C (cathepsin A)